MHILLFLFLFVLILILGAVFRIISFFVRARRAVRNVFGGESGGNGGRRQQTKTQPKHRRKKIEKDVGEYVEFEEVACTVKTQTTQDATRTDIQIESQIEDVQWEDIP